MVTERSKVVRLRYCEIGIREAAQSQIFTLPFLHSFVQAPFPSQKVPRILK